ncbi:MAG: zinc ribbon domain-containing protein [Desulfovibrionaceae bacterium]|nr:zinc ribbon domain-containing protein [Desulfovibrionaceae bacterium]
MPLYDFVCEDCGKKFDELVFEDDDPPFCPACGSARTKQSLSVPSPTLKNPFPYKVGPVNQAFVDNVRRNEARIARGEKPACSSCASCAHAQGAKQD